MSGLYGLLGMLVFCVAVYGWRLTRDEGLKHRFTDELGPQDAEEDRLFPKIEARIAPLGYPVVRALQLDDPRRREKVRQKVDAAGRPGGLTVERYAQRKGAILVLGGAVVLLAVVSGSWLSAVAVLFLSGFGYDAWLDGTAARRQERIDRDLPDLLDVLAVCVSAGVAFRPALTRVAEATDGPLRDEMQTVLRQIQLGAPRREAFEALRHRNTSDGISVFVTAVQQAEELGVPITDALVDLSRDMRQTAFQKARQRAQQAAPRVSVVTTLVIAPGAVIIIMASLFAGFDFGLVNGG